MKGKRGIAFWRHDLLRVNGLGLVLLALLIQLAIPIAHARQMLGGLTGQDAMDALDRDAAFHCLTGAGEPGMPAKMPMQCALCQSLAANAAPLPLPAPLLLRAAPIAVTALAVPAFTLPPARGHGQPPSRAPPVSL